MKDYLLTYLLSATDGQTTRKHNAFVDSLHVGGGCIKTIINRAAVGMGIPMGIPMGMGMVWVWGL